MTILGEMKQTAPTILLYGAPGTGKTALVETLGSGLRLFDLDNGAVTGLTLKDKWEQERRKVDVVQVLEDDPKKGVAFTKAKSYVLGVAEECKKGSFKHKAVCIDSFTALADAAIRYVKGNAGHLEANTTLPEWGLAFQELENILTILRSLPLVVILIAHEDQYETEAGPRTEIAIPGRKLPRRVTGYFDEVIRTKIVNAIGGKTDFVLQTKATAGTIARSRRNLPDGTRAEIGMAEILKLMGFNYGS